MSDSFESTTATIRAELSGKQRNQEKLALLARGLRWHRTFDDEDMASLLELGKFVQRKRGAGCWDVERAILEILCERAEDAHIPFLVDTFQRNAPGKYSNDRRRLALQALSYIAVRSGNADALALLEEGLRHTAADTRGWAIGFMMDAYDKLDRPIPQSAIERLQELQTDDANGDVRVEAVKALVNVGMADLNTINVVVAIAQRGANGSTIQDQAQNLGEEQ